MKTGETQMQTETVAGRLSRQYPGELPALLGMIGEANAAARYSALTGAADAAKAALDMCSGEPADVFSLPGPMGCDAETHAAIVAMHEAAMAARDLFYAREIKPIVDEAKRVSGRS
jgi:hypothetical protein